MPRPMAYWRRVSGARAYPVSSGPAISPARRPEVWVTDGRIAQVGRRLVVPCDDHLTQPDRHERC
jgi:hypothetical protein